MDALLELSRNPSWPSDSEMAHSSVGMRSGASVFEPPLQLFLFSSQFNLPEARASMRSSRSLRYVMLKG